VQALRQGSGLVIVVDGLASDGDARALAATISDVANDARREGIEAPAVVQCVLTSQGELRGPGGARRSVKLGRLTEEEQQAVCRRWMARFGKENVSDQQVRAAVRKADSMLPLYLVLFSNEASLHAIFETIGDALDSYPQNIHELWGKKTLRRLEQDCDVGLVAYFMQHLLGASVGGMSVRHLKACAAQHQPLLARVPVPEQSQMIDSIAANLRPFVYTRDGDHLFLRSATLRTSSMRHYAPRALQQDRVRERLVLLTQQNQGVWGQARKQIVHLQPEPLGKDGAAPPLSYAAHSTWAFDWVFEQVHRNLQVKMEDRQLNCHGSDLVSALVSPEVAKDRPSYFEVKIDKCDSDVSIKVGLFIASTDRDMRLVPHRRAVSQHLNGWLLNCKNGNLVNNSTGNEWLPREPRLVCKGSTVGICVPRSVSPPPSRVTSLAMMMMMRECVRGVRARGPHVTACPCALSACLVVCDHFLCIQASWSTRLWEGCRRASTASTSRMTCR
jgi:hypothetical protein